MKESQIEHDFYDYVRTRGGWLLKQNPAWFANIPDRLVLTHNGGHGLLELKRPGEEPTPGQLKVMRRLRAKGHSVEWADSLEKAKAHYIGLCEQEQWLSDDKHVLASALREIYAFFGEDPKISKIVNTALRKANVE